VKKLILVVAGAIAAGSAGAVLGMGPSGADPSNSNSTANVTGEPYAKAVAILQAQGYKAVFGGSVGSEVPQAQCLVESQKMIAGGSNNGAVGRLGPTSSGKMQLMLNCTKKAQESLDQGTGPVPSMGGGGDGGGRPTPGAPGVVTVTPTQVG
jgi:hypothetical protein